MKAGTGSKFAFDKAGQLLLKNRTTTESRQGDEPRSLTIHSS
jgi:hypothetical protein